MALFRRKPKPDAQRVFELQRIIDTEDAAEAEAGRDRVRPQEVPAIIDLYWGFEDWDKKRMVVDLLQDQTHPKLEDLMVDFLRAPMPAGDEWTELAKAAALGFVGEDYDRFMDYYNDRALLRRNVDEVLAARGLEAMPTPRTPDPQPAAARDDTALPTNQRLMNAAASNDLDAAGRAIDDGAKLEVKIGSGTYEGFTPLLYACLNGSWDVAGLLVERGADVNIKRPDFHRPDKKRGQTPLWWAATKGSMETVERLVRAGADINTPDHHGSTPVVEAASSGHLEVLRYFGARGGDFHAAISDGRTGLNLAVNDGHCDVVRYLLEVGMDPDGRGSAGYTPLMVAAQNGKRECIAALLEHGADVNAQHTGAGWYSALTGYTPLVFSVNAGFVKASKMLIDAGADPAYVVPARERYDGQPYEPAAVIEFADGKRAESLRKLLRDAGA